MCSRWGSSQALETELNPTSEEISKITSQKGCWMSCDCNMCVNLIDVLPICNRPPYSVCVCVLSNRRRMSSLSTNWANFMVWWADRGRLADSPLKAVSFEAVSVYVCVWRSVRGGVCSPIVTGVVGLLQLGDESHSGGRASHCSMAAFPVWRTTVTFTNAVQC